MAKHTIVAMIQIETDDPRLRMDRLNWSTAAGVAKMRKAVMDNLGEVSRVIAVMSRDEAKLMCWAHDQALRAAGAEFNRPPPDYIPPTRD